MNSAFVRIASIKPKKAIGI